MSNSQEKFDLIQQYLEKSLSPEEMIAFEQELETDAKLTEEVRFHRLADELCFEKGLIEIWEKVGEDLSQQPPSPSFKGKILFGLLAFILSASIVYFATKKEKEVNLPSKTLSLSEDEFASELGNKTSAKKVKEDNLTENPAKKRINIEDPILENDQPGIFKADSNSEIKTPFVPQKAESFKEVKPLNTDPLINSDKSCPEISFNIRTEPSCKNEDNGSIQIIGSEIKGGEKPYSYSIGGKDFNSQSYNNHLAKGIYLVQIKDKQGCLAENRAEVSEKVCIEYKDYTFNSHVETWKIPISTEESGTITITNQAGRIVFKNRISNGSPEEWDGKALTGEELEMGTYYYIVQTDKGEIRQGYITIVY